MFVEISEDFLVFLLQGKRKKSKVSIKDELGVFCNYPYLCSYFFPLVEWEQTMFSILVDLQRGWRWAQCWAFTVVEHGG